MADQTLHTRLLAEIGSWADVNGRLSPPEAALRAVVEQHAPVASNSHPGGFRCGVCLRRHRWSPSVPWPCSTIQVIADQLGLTQDQERHREEDRRG